MKSAEELLALVYKAISYNSETGYLEVDDKLLLDAFTARDAEHINETQRMRDLVRLARHFLLEEKAISEDEYAALVQQDGGSKAARRLESYDVALAEHAEERERSGKEFRTALATRDAEIARLYDVQNKATQERERLEVQLAGCGVAAQGWSRGEQRAKQGDWGWSPSYQDVLELREKWERSVAHIAQLEKDLAAATGERAWVIERRDGGKLTYLTCDGLGNGLDWSAENLKALRFARHEDADHVAAIFDDLDVGVFEHMWPSALPLDAPEGK